MSRSVVFISHIAPEKEIAIAFKELIEASFLGMIDVFVSSDEHSIGMGQRWLEDITKALKTCSIEILLCSPQSVTRPWINFEAGACWIRDIPVIPLCHSGIEPTTLPLPLNLCQGATANQVSSLSLIFPVLARAIGSQTPSVDFTGFVAKVTDFERRYTYWDACNAAFSRLHAYDTGILPALRAGLAIELDLTEQEIGKFEDFMAVLARCEILRFQRSGTTKWKASGMYHSCQLIPLKNLDSTIKDPNFRV